MSAKTAYQFSAAGVYLGPTEADESPLEPGVFLLPARCTFTPPPDDVPDGKVARWSGTAWALATAPNDAAQAAENPLAKLQAFLTANPDVAALVTTGGV